MSIFDKSWINTESDTPTDVDVLCIDAMSVLQGIVDRTDATKDKIITESLKYIDALIDKYQPKKRIYVAVSGLLHISLLQSHRLQSYKRYHDNMGAPTEGALTEGALTERATEVNSVNIGTQLMKNFEIKILKNIKKYKILSSSKEAGTSGEKIMRFVNKNHNLKTVIYSTNQHLLYMALLSNNKHLYIINDAIDAINAINAINIEALKSKIIEDLERKTQFRPKNRSVWIYDMVILLLFVDPLFLPQIPTFLAQNTKENAMVLLLAQYVKTHSHLKLNLVHRTKSINIKFLIELFKPFAKSESDIFQDNFKKKRFETGKAPTHLALKEKLLYEYENLAIERLVDPVQLGKSGWKNRYYRHHFDIESTDKNSLQEIGSSYLKGINWCFKYYNLLRVDPEWFYCFHQSPHLSDLLHTIKQVDINAFTHSKNKPKYTPNEQLLALLPLQSASLLPMAYRQLLTSVESPIGDFYPLTFQQDFLLKQKRSQGVAIVPFVDMQRIRDAVMRIKT